MGNASVKNRRVLGFFAHPDDCEILAAGTIILLQKQGFEVHIATVSTGDMGSVEHSAPEISRMRFGEAQKAARLINGVYHCLGEADVKFNVSLKLREKTVELFRQVNPGIIFTHSPQDYMLDHVYTADLAWDGCFNAPIPNYVTNEPNPAVPADGIPYLFYSDSLEGKDRFGAPIEPEFYIDISGSMDTKIEMLKQHDSQRSWLRAQHGLDHYVESMKSWCGKRGDETGVRYAEVFRQHRGHAFPQENILEALIGVRRRMNRE